MQQNSKTLKQGGQPWWKWAPFHTPPRAYRQNLLESVVYPQIWVREDRESKRKWQRERVRSSSSCIASPSQSQRWNPGEMPPWLYRVTVTASLHQTHGTHLPLWATVMVPQTQAPSGREERGRKRRRRVSGWGNLPSYNASVPVDAVNGT